jgi:hypothetical protein
MTNRSRAKRTGSPGRQPDQPKQSNTDRPAPEPLTRESWPSIGLAGVISDQLDQLIEGEEEPEDDPLRLGQIERVSRILAQYPGVPGSSVFDPLCRYLSERVANISVWIGDGGTSVVACRASVQVRVQLPPAVVEYRERAAEAS